MRKDIPITKNCEDSVSVSESSRHYECHGCLFVWEERKKERKNSTWKIKRDGKVGSCWNRTSVFSACNSGKRQGPATASVESWPRLLSYSCQSEFYATCRNIQASCRIASLVVCCLCYHPRRRTCGADTNRRAANDDLSLPKGIYLSITPNYQHTANMRSKQPSKK